MIKASVIVVILLGATILSVLPSCRKKHETEKQRSERAGSKREAVRDSEVGIGQGPDAVNNPMLYQKHDSIENALSFIGAPEDEMEKYLGCVNGVLRNVPKKLAKGEQLTFANKLFSLRRSKDTDMLMSLVSNTSKEQLDNCGDRECMLRHHIRDVKDGTFLHGELECRFFATFCRLTEGFLDYLKEHVSFPETPTHAVIYYRFQKDVLLGATFYLIKDDHTYKLVTYTLLHDEVSPAPKEQSGFFSGQSWYNCETWSHQCSLAELIWEISF